jgi:hypothetical protein
MQDEFDSLTKNNTWTLVKDMPPGRKAIGCRWVFKRKLNNDGSVSRYKARLVAKGYSQRHGIDYEETYAPVAKFTSIRTILAIGAALDLEIHQMDVKTAFLNGDLEEEIYMDVPEGLKVPSGYKCKLNRTLYGLKQSPRMWNKKLDMFLHDIGFKVLQTDTSLYVRKDDTELTMIAVYVDDLLILSSMMDALNEVKKALTMKFEMSDEGDIDGNTHLGFRITRDRAKRSLTMDQETYAKSILTRFGMEDCNPVVTPLNPGVKLLKEENEDSEMKKRTTHLQQIIGSLMYLMLGTRPDLAAAVGIVSQFASRPSPAHLHAAQHILKYVKGTTDVKLHFKQKGDLTLTGYTDSDWGGDVNTRRSVSGYLFKLHGGAVSWSSKHQPTVALSSMEAEYMALTHATKEAIWLKMFLAELGMDLKQPLVLYEDNQSSVQLVKHPAHHACTKHIDIRHHFVREKVENGEIDLRHLPTSLMTADALTKPLGRQIFERHRKEMGLLGEDDPPDRTSVSNSA